MPGDHPDILYLITDQQRADALSCVGATAATPNLDRLAATGARVERCYCTNPVCVPSRFSLMTGLMPSAGRTRSNDPEIDRQPGHIRARGLGHLLGTAGYRCLYAGKQHLPAMDATDLGFEVITADERDGCAETCATVLAEERDGPLLLVASFINPHDICYLPHYRIEPETMTTPSAKLGKACLERILEPVAALAGDRLAAFLEGEAPPLPANHDRNGSEPPLVTRHDERHRLVRIPHREWEGLDWRLFRWVYDRLVEDVDRQIGRVLDALEASGRADDTLVLFTSDHGEMNGSHHLTQKGVCYEEAIRVPLVARHPGCIPAGSVIDGPLVSNGLDLYPTICAAAGVAPPEPAPGFDLGPLLRGEGPGPRRDHLEIELDGADLWHDGRRKREVYDDGTVMERDLAVDPLEMSVS